jgi:hypothetical protein
MLIQLISGGGEYRLMDEVLLYAEYEASHFIFRLTWNMEKQAIALEGKMQALRVLLEVSRS